MDPSVSLFRSISAFALAVASMTRALRAVRSVNDGGSCVRGAAISFVTMR
jgi:hypothetical protein